jgi:Alcohol dehydrogenase GroES-like domain
MIQINVSSSILLRARNNIRRTSTDVRFAPKSGHRNSTVDVCFVPKADIVHCAVQQIQTYSITSSARAAHLVSRTELLPVTCFEFFISGLTSNACPNPRTESPPFGVRRNNVKSGSPAKYFYCWKILQENRSLEDRMQAAFYVKQGPAREVLQVGEQPKPEPGPGEVRVHLKTSGANPSDWKSRSGRTAPMSTPLIIPHSDGAGDIDRVGPGVTNRIGERVWVWNGQWRRPHGTAAEYIVLPSAQLPFKQCASPSSGQPRL